MREKVRLIGWYECWWYNCSGLCSEIANDEWEFRAWVNCLRSAHIIEYEANVQAGGNANII